MSRARSPGIGRREIAPGSTDCPHNSRHLLFLQDNAHHAAHEKQRAVCCYLLISVTQPAAVLSRAPCSERGLKLNPWRVNCPASAELRMASSRKRLRNGYSSEGLRSIGYETAPLCEQCLSESTMAVLEVVPNPQAARMNDRDRET